MTDVFSLAWVKPHIRFCNINASSEGQNHQIVCTIIYSSFAYNSSLNGFELDQEHLAS
jgi:hypothetical protein